MTVIAALESPIAELFDHSDGVLDSATVLEFLSPGELHWRVEPARWQRPCRGIVAHSALAGLTAAWLDRFTGFGDPEQIAAKMIHVLVSSAYKRRTASPWQNIKIHYSRMLTDLDVHPLREPGVRG